MVNGKVIIFRNNSFFIISENAKNKKELQVQYTQIGYKRLLLTGLFYIPTILLASKSNNSRQYLFQPRTKNKQKVVIIL